ncbi:myomegalin-like isoform X4 [Branchiostoma lanceolatum]|uniref:myomegalin-like isoform X4 n=1 Tax=Branchiostoma lanceolatum TaxID=7740 RepID=UPI0034562FB8
MMDSVVGEDPTLPLDFNHSTNLTSLPDTTMDGSQQQSLRNVSSGRMSPVRIRTMKDYEEQIAELKKENFSLKLRIYFMEERMQHGEEEDIEKTNIELKVEVESLKKELHDKQELLVKASQAVETLAAQNDAAVQQVRQDHGRELQQLHDQYESRLTSAQEENSLQKRVDEETEGKIRDLEAANQELQNKLRDLEKVKQDKKNLQDSSKEALQDKNSLPHAQSDTEDCCSCSHHVNREVIDQLNHALRTKDQLIQQLNQEKSDLVGEKVKPLEAQVQSLTQELKDKEGNMQDDISRYQQQVEVSKKNNQEIQALLEDQQRKLDEYEIAAGQMTRDHDKKEKEIKELEKLVLEAEDENEELKRKLQDKDSDVKLQEQNALKRDKAIQGLTEAIHNKSKEIDELCEQIEELQQSLAQARETAHKAQLQQFQGVEEQQQALGDKEVEITGLQGKVHEKDAENQRLKKSLRKKEQEIDQLQQAAQEADDQAEEALRDKDRQLRDLQKQLKDSRSKADSEKENITQQHKTQLEETQRQLQSKEQIIQRLSASIQEKDRVIQEYMQMAQEQENSRDPYSENKDSIIQRLRERLKERDKAVEDAIEEKFRTLEAKENDLRHLRVNLRERERELERANSLLTGNEETINNLDGIIKEKDVELRQLLNQLKSQQRTNAATAEEHARALMEKEALIEQLQQALSSRDKDIKKLSQSLQSSPHSKPRVDAMIQELKDKLDERDRMLQEVMEERRRASSDGQAHTQRLLGTIKDKDNMLKEANERYNQVVSEKNGEIQKLQQRLNNREAELQSLTSARDWTEQEQNKLLEKMRSALSDKDRTIETLVENAREKDKLLSQLQMSGPSQLRGEHLADTVRQLKDDIRKKDELIDRLQSSSTSGYVSTEDDPYVQSLRKELASKARLLSETTAALQSLRDQKPAQGDLQQQMAQQTQALSNALKAEKQAKLELAKVRRKAQEQEEDLGTKQENIDALIEAVRAKDNIIKDLERSQLSSRQTLRGDQSPKAKQQLQKGLRDQLEETKKLNELLDSERRIYQDLIKSYRDELGATRDSQSRALDIELAAVQTLRRQLEDYVRRNSELRAELERNINQAAQQVLEARDSLRDRPQVQTWNAALQTSIDDLRPQFEKNIQTSPITRSTDIEISLPSPLDALSVSEFSTAELKSEVARLRGQLSRMQAINDDLQSRLNGAISEQVRSIPLGENIAEQQTLPKLAKEVERLEAELDNAQKKNQALQEELESGRGSMTPMTEKGLLAEVQQQLEDAIMQLEKSEDDKQALEKQIKLSSPSPYQAQIKQLENKVMELIEENEQLMKESPGSRSDEEVDAMSEKDLRTEVKGLKDRLKASENLVDLLKKQLEMNSDSENDIPGFNPELIVQLAEEIERLKGQLEQAQGNRGDVRDKEEESSDTSSQLPRKSKLPVLQKGVTHNANASLRQQIEQLKMSEKELKLLNRRMQDKLTATEGTVRAQAQKLKSYRKMLEDAGLVKKLPRKAQSDSNIPMSLQRFQSRYASQEGLDDSLLSPGISPAASPMMRSPATSLLSLETLQEYGNTDNVDELKQQVSQLKQRLEKSRRMIRGMQSRLRGRSDGQLTPNRSFARSMEALTEPTTNGDAFEKLRQQVEDLKQQLKDSNDLNKTLADQLSVSPQKDTLVQTQAKELSQLRKQLRDSREMCHLLRARLEELTRTLEHLLSASEGGDPDLLNLTQQEAEGVMAELERSMHLARTLKDRLDDNASSASDDSSLRSLKDQYQQSLQANQELRLQLQEQLMQLQDRPSPTPLKQEIAELRSALEEQQDQYQHLKQVNQQLQGQVADTQHLRRQLAENQRTAIELKDELERATKDAKEKNNMISRLRSQLRRTRPVGSTFPPSASDQASTGWDTDQSNQGASDDFSGMHRVGSGRSANHGSQTASGSEDNMGEQPRQRRYPPNRGDEYSLEQPGRSKPTSSEDNFMFAPREKVIPPSIHSSKDDVSGCGRLHDNRGYSSDEESTTSTQTFTSVSRHESDHPEDSEQDGMNNERGMYPSRQLPSKFLQASLGHGSTTTVSTETNREMELLQNRLRASDQINRSLRAELDTYKKLRESTETIHSHGSASTTSGFHGDSRGGNLLEEHLAELRALRARLEDSLSSNEQLRQELEDKISSMSNRGGQTNIYVHSNSGVDHQEFPDNASHGSHMSDKLSLLSDKTTQVDRLQAELDQKDQINEKLKADMSRLQTQLTEKDQQNQQIQGDNTRLQTDMSKLQKQLAERDRQTQKTQAEFTQLQADLSSLHGQLQEVSQLQNQLSDREKQNQILQTEVDSLGAELANRDMENDKVSAELTKAKKEISRLRQELSRLQDQLEEHQQVADSLRLELRLYEKLYKKAQTADAGVNGFSSSDGTGGRDAMAGLDLSGLLEEMRRLREQVEKLHISNSALRRKVKELLGKEESPTVININHHHGHRSPAQRALFQTGAGDASPGDVHLSGPYTTDSAHSSPANYPHLKNSPLVGQLARYASLPVLDKDDIDVFSMQGVSPLSTADVDIRYRYVVGRIEDYEALRHQVNDSRLAIRGVQSRVKDRLKALKKALDSTQPGDQKPLEETLSSLHLLHDHLEECHRLLKLFWKARDPGSVPTSTGSGGDGTAIVFLENQNLKDEITNLRKRLTSQEKVMRSALHKLERTNRLKQGMEEALVKQCKLSKTHHVLRQARGNLEFSVSSSSSLDQSLASSMDDFSL